MNALLIDAGNTRLKWALAAHGELRGHGESGHRERPADEAFAPLRELRPPPSQVFVANVAGTAMTTRLGTLARTCYGCEARFAQVEPDRFGLQVAYADPSRLGVDRWLAMLGAREVAGLPVLVADLGTAVTLDALDASARHLGGAIAPGRRLMRRAVLEQTAGIRDAGPEAASEHLFANDTGEAVRAGTDHALAALIVRAADLLERRLGVRPPVLLTGGDARVLAPLLAEPIQVYDDLVLRGLRVYADASQ